MIGDKSQPSRIAESAIIEALLGGGATDMDWRRGAQQLGQPLERILLVFACRSPNLISAGLSHHGIP